VEKVEPIAPANIGISIKAIMININGKKSIGCRLEKTKTLSSRRWFGNNGWTTLRNLKEFI
jgi:hypothetical protein